MPRPVEISHVAKAFGSVRALDDVSLTVEAGSMHGLLGPNGAGKSTLLRTLFGLVRPDAGRVLIFGRDHETSGPALALRGVAGFVDRPHFYPYLTARRNLTLMCSLDGLDAGSAVDGVLARVGLSHAANRRVTGWSTGMNQRLGIAAALLRSPRLLIVDEPTEGLDPAASIELINIFRSLVADGVAVIFSSHNMDEVDLVCDTVTVLHHGRVVRSGALTELRREAPAGSHRLVTSDDEAATVLAQGRAISLSSHPRGGLLIEADQASMHNFICALGRHDVSVSSLEQDIAPLSAMFFALTEEAAA